MEIKLWVKRAKKGDKEALVELIMAQKSDYYKLAYVYLKNKEDALDAMEDMIIGVYENIDTLKNEAVFYSWSKTILVNCCKKVLRERSRVVSIDTVKEQSYEDNLEERNNKIVLDEYLSELQESHQEIIRLRYLLDLDYQSIANLLKIPLGTVKSRLYYGVGVLQKKFGGERHE
jgi:RNA polymerase sigma-70 factor (ECF subfamily)